MPSISNSGAAPDLTVLDIGAGSGDLLHALRRRRPDWSTTAVDIRPAPPNTTAEWLTDIWDVRTGAWTTNAVDVWWKSQQSPVVVIGHEFLDELPCPVGPPATAAAQQWTQQWWPDSNHPHLPEVGTTRDAAWADVITRLQRTGGLAIAVDYGHVLTTRPDQPTLRGFRDGQLVPPSFDGTVNLTSDVAMDAVAAAAVAAGSELVWAGTQQQAAERWLPATPSPDPTAPDAAPLADLLARNQRQVFHNPTLGGQPGFGSYHWLVHHVSPQQSTSAHVAG